MTLLTACGGLKIDKAIDTKSTDSALCEGLRKPINDAVNTTLEYSNETPPPVVNDWRVVVEGYDSQC